VLPPAPVSARHVTSNTDTV